MLLFYRQPSHGTFASLGGDGMCALWDASAKKRLRQYPRFPSPLSTGAISPNGQLFVLATGAENVEDARHVGPGAGEVGGLGQGGTGNVRIFVKGSIWEDGKVRRLASCAFPSFISELSPFTCFALLSVAQWVCSQFVLVYRGVEWSGVE